MAKLARAVFVRDKDTSRDVLLNSGDEPPAKYAVLVKNPACWEGGKLPAAVKRHMDSDADTSGGDETDSTGNAPKDSQGSGDGSDTSSGSTAPGEPTEDTKTATKKATAPARGRKAAAEGTGGQ
ncbi:hypothetical protein [Streptomyces sp. NPDC058657]|uniref:hypothetical protein n=1 Tax=unclassified Streptomyces TaxID=2593676 RepID=UPI0036519436